MKKNILPASIITTSLCLITIFMYPSCNQQFAPFNLELTDQNKHVLQSLHITQDATYDNFGHLEILED